MACVCDRFDEGGMIVYPLHDLDGMEKLVKQQSLEANGNDHNAGAEQKKRRRNTPTSEARRFGEASGNTYSSAALEVKVDSRSPPHA